MGFIDEHNNSVLDLWREHKRLDFVPLLYSTDLKKEAILFIGLNPSLSESGYKSTLKDTDYERVSDDIKDFYSWSKYNKECTSKYISVYEVYKSKNAYFKKFEEISKKCNLSWEHIDLFYIRETNQKSVEDLFKKNIVFFQKQINSTLKLIDHLQPRIIVVENAFASKILKEPMKLEFSDIYGTYLYKDVIPVFFSGMLTGQRALDLGSFDRLVWHIDMLLKSKLPFHK